MLVCEPKVVTVVVLDALDEVDETGLRESTSSVVEMRTEGLTQSSQSQPT